MIKCKIGFLLFVCKISFLLSSALPRSCPPPPGLIKFSNCVANGEVTLYKRASPATHILRNSRPRVQEDGNNAISYHCFLRQLCRMLSACIMSALGECHMPNPLRCINFEEITINGANSFDQSTNRNSAEMEIITNSAIARPPCSLQKSTIGRGAAFIYSFIVHLPTAQTVRAITENLH